ncbi:MAG TPA: hypothetical protein VN181_05685 [Thermoanaerobaculia bacterium]|nr:hypothetical protein [Thermoanaerobaculia bacterium]
MRRTVAILLLLFLDCKAKAPAKRSAEVPIAPAPVTANANAGTYAAAVKWFRTTHGFHFELQNGVSATGEMTRPSPGAERVLVRANDGEWLGAASASGVAWYHREGPGWTIETKPPAFANAIFERVTTLPEGDAHLAGTDAELNHFRVAGAGELWVSRRDNHVAKMKIADRFGSASLTITPDESVNVPQP